jgi:hypothetical protein
MPPRRSRKLTRAPTAAEANAELARREAADLLDPVKQYKPGPTASRCRDSQKLYRLINGGNQVGKTAYAVWECASILRGIHPAKPSYGPVTLLVVIPSRQQAVALWGKRLLEASQMPGELGSKPYLPPEDVEKVFWNYSGSGKAPGRILMKNGSEVYFAWAGDDAMWERIQGLKLDYIIRDEAVGNKKLGPELIMRLVAVQSDPSRPWAGGILWVGTPTLDNEEYDEFQKRCREGKPGYEEFFIQPHENPAVSMLVREAARDTMDEDDQAVRLDGGASAVDRNKIFRRQWSDERHVAKVDYEPGITDNLWITFDPGMGHPAGTLYAALNEEAPKTLRIVKFAAVRNMPLHYHIAQMAEWLDGRFVEGVVLDPASLKRESSGKSIYTQFEELLFGENPPFKTFGLYLGRNRHWDGINQVWRYLDPEPGNPMAPPLVLVNPTSPGCGLFAYQMKSYRGREETKYTGPQGVVKKNDEGPDTLRYLITKDPTYVFRGVNACRNGAQAPYVPRVDPSELNLATLTPELRLHQERLTKSIRMMEQEHGGDEWRTRTMGSSALAWSL